MSGNEEDVIAILRRMVTDLSKKGMDYGYLTISVKAKFEKGKIVVTTVDKNMSTTHQ